MPRYGRKIHFACLQHFSFVLRGKLQILRFTNIKNVEIVENSELFHGDFILQMGTVEIGDLISEQITVHERQDDKVLRSDKLEDDKEEADSEASIPLEAPLPQDNKKQKKTRNKNQDE